MQKVQQNFIDNYTRPRIFLVRPIRARPSKEASFLKRALTRVSHYWVKIQNQEH